MLSKFLIGQSISAETKSGKIFEGTVYRNKEGKKVALNENGKWLPLDKLSKIKQTGRKLNEEYQQAIDGIISTLSNEKVKQKLDANEGEKIAGLVADKAGIPESDENRQDAVKYGQEKLVGMAAAEEAKSSGNKEAMDKAAEELKDIEMTPKEASEKAKELDEMKESLYQKNKALFKKYKESAGDDFMYDAIDDTDNGDEMFDDYIAGAGHYDDPVMQTLADNSEYNADGIDSRTGKSYDDPSLAAPNFYDQPDEDMIGSEVDDAFEGALDDYEEQGGSYDDEELLECLVSRFGGDAKKALKEANGNIPTAVVKLSEQVKRQLLQESTVKACANMAIKYLANFYKNGIDAQQVKQMNDILTREAACQQGIDGMKGSSAATAILTACYQMADAYGIKPADMRNWLIKNKARLGSMMAEATETGNQAADIQATSEKTNGAGSMSTNSAILQAKKNLAK